jgi:hypothetical protein
MVSSLANDASMMHRSPGMIGEVARTGYRAVRQFRYDLRDEVSEGAWQT